MKKRVLLSLIFLFYCFDLITDQVVAKETKVVPAKLVNSSFDSSYYLIRKWEGNYSNVKGDKGGVTYAGITKRNYPKWDGWKHIGTKHKYNDSVPHAEPFVKKFYSDKWIDGGFDQLHNQKLANALFDISTHHSKNTCIKLVNASLKRMKLLEVDPDKGYWAYQVEYILMLGDYETNVIRFIEELRSERINMFYRITKRDSTQKKFLKGWLRRAKSV